MTGTAGAGLGALRNAEVEGRRSPNLLPDEQESDRGPAARRGAPDKPGLGEYDTG
jgi:hypothetical protein